MEIKDFIQKCANHGIEAVTTKEISNKLNLSRSTTMYRMKTLEKEGCISLFTHGKLSYWHIWLENNGPLIPNDYGYCGYSNIPPINGFDQATRRSMKANCIRVSAKPDIDTIPILDLSHEADSWLWDDLYTRKLSPAALKEDGMSIRYLE